MRKPREFYVENGFEDLGYNDLPELSSTDPYPDYIHKEVLECAERIKNHQNEDSVTLGFMTDIHYALNENHNVRMQRTVNAYKELAARVPIDKLILGGDFTNEGCKSYKTQCFMELREHLKSLQHYPVLGNHDDGSIWDFSYIEAESSTNHLTHEEIYHLFFEHLKSETVEFGDGDRGLYYYCDDPIKKIRYIFLDSQDIPYIYDAKGKLKYTGQFSYALSQKQLDWLVSSALKTENEEYGILLIIHSVDMSSSVAATAKRPYLAVLSEILECYQKGQECWIELEHEDFGVKVQADFSRYVRSKVLGVLVGHYHRDMVSYGEGGFPYIFTANSVMYYEGKPTELERTDGDASELLFDVITINRKEGKMYITRVGAGEDRVVEI